MKAKNSVLFFGVILLLTLPPVSSMETLPDQDKGQRQSAAGLIKKTLAEKGIKIPFIFIRNVGSLESPHGGVVEEVRINVEFDDALFIPPDRKK